jgi:Glycosyltransferase family 87
MANMPVRSRLLRDGFLVLAAYFAIHAILMSRRYGLGWDAHAYYVAWSGGLYEALPGSIDAYNYSPLFAQLTAPLTLLPWPLYCAVLIGAAAGGVAWLVRPLPVPLAVGAWFACLPEILSGNVFWLLALMTVLGFAHGSPWCAAAFTKLLPCLGPVWFLVRGEWRHLAGFVATALALLSVSVLVSPGEWLSWLDFLRASAGSSSGVVYLTPMALPFPLAARLPLALIVVVVAARTDRRWLVPVAMVVASPVVGGGTFALLAAIPRLRRADGSAAAQGRPASSAEARTLTR